MPQPHGEGPLPAPGLRQRLAADIAAGRTVSLSAEEMADPELRLRLPALLAELTGADAGGLQPGLRLPDYTVLGAIGHGGMSTVYLARHDALARYVALKVANWSGTDRKKRDRLVQEARAMARVSHPNIVAIHDIVDVGDTVAIAMEWVDGLSLEALLRALPAVPDPSDIERVRAALGAPQQTAADFDAAPVRFFVGLVLGVARALQRVHEAGLLHLDVKPSNVLVRRDGTPLLADFGVVREIDVGLANTRSFAGTPIYSAPEQLSPHGRRFGPHTDVYGLGITLYEVLARRQPLLGHDLTQLVQTVAKGRIPALGTQIAVAKDLETIVRKAMAPEPAHRYASAAAFADDLQAFLEGRPVAARPLSRLRRAQRWARLEPWKAALVAVLLVTLPVVSYLGVQLLLGMPHIEAGVLRQRRQQANELKQSAYQLRFVAQIDSTTAVDMLQQAMALDPTDNSLACLVSMVMAEDPQAVTPLLAQHGDAVARSKGLQLLAIKARDQRPFFDDAEVGELATSEHAIDWYVLALDRVSWAEDVNHEDFYAQTLLHVQAAAMGQEADPLLMGLAAWVASQAGDREVQDAICRAMHLRWPDSTEALRWDCLTHEMRAPEVAATIAGRWVERDPTCVAAWELLVGGAMRSGRYEEALALAERARAVPMSSPTLDWFYVALLHQNGRVEQGRHALAAMPHLKLDFRQQVRLLRSQGAESVRKFCDERLRSAHPARSDLEHIVREAGRLGDADLGERAFDRWQKEHPGFRCMYPFEMQRRYRAKDVLGAARLAREFRSPRRRLDTDGGVLCGIFTTANDWPALADVAQRWLQSGSAAHRPQAAFYAGLAASRLGDLESAAQQLAVATVATTGERPTAWFTSALLERAWVHVAPSTPPALRDPDTARLLLDRFDEANRALRSPRRGRWIDTVRAEVLFANGDSATAVATATAGLAAEDDARLAAPADCRDLLRAALERYGR